MERKVSDTPPRWGKRASVTLPSASTTPTALLVVPKSRPTLRSISILLWSGASWQAYTTRRRHPRGGPRGVTQIVEAADLRKWLRLFRGGPALVGSPAE